MYLSAEQYVFIFGFVLTAGFGGWKLGVFQRTIRMSIKQALGR